VKSELQALPLAQRHRDERGKETKMTLHRQFGRNVMMGVVALGMSVCACQSAWALQDHPTKSQQKSPAVPKEIAPQADANLPSADDIHARYIDAIGGEKAIRAHTYRTSSGDFSIPDFGINGTFKVQQAAPHFFLLSLNIPSVGSSQHGYNGEVGWTKDDNQGPMLHEGDMLEEISREGDFYSDLNVKDHFPKRETVGKEEFGGTMCYKVHMVSPHGSDSLSFYALDTGLLVGLKGEASTPQGDLSTVTLMEDYKVENGVKMPHKITVTYPDLKMKQVMTFKEVSNDEFSKDVFDLPKEIATLVELQKEAKAKGDDDDGDNDADDDDDDDDDDEEDDD